MNQFEEIAKYLLEAEGNWVKTSVKVDISKEAKRELGTPSMPRPEIDIVAYNPRQNSLKLIEAKSYLNSRGVYFSHIERREPKWDKYKLLTYNDYQEVVSTNLKTDFIRRGLITEDTKIQFGLIAGRLHMAEKNDFYSLAKSRNWFFWGPNELKIKLKAISSLGYEDNPYSMVIKLLS